MAPLLAVLFCGCVVVNQQAVATSSSRGQATAVVSSGRSVAVARSGRPHHLAVQTPYVPPGATDLNPQSASPSANGWNGADELGLIALAFAVYAVSGAAGAWH
jgi:hypothetical protein